MSIGLFDIARSNEKASRKFDFPAPFAPIRTLSGLSGTSTSSPKLLKPFMAMLSSLLIEWGAGSTPEESVHTGTDALPGRLGGMGASVAYITAQPGLQRLALAG